jgi:hypothetical protein
MHSTQIMPKRSGRRAKNSSGNRFNFVRDNRGRLVSTLEPFACLSAPQSSSGSGFDHRRGGARGSHRWAPNWERLFRQTL